MNLSDIRVNNRAIVVDGTEYVITTGTGEASTRLGQACFAYDADDVQALVDVADYQSFCDQSDPVVDRDLAVSLAAREDLRLLAPGGCSPVLTDDEYSLVRAAAAAIERS